MVILIIAILAGLVLSISGIVARRADRARAASDMERIKNALEAFRVSQGEYPASTSGLGSYGLTNAPTDPWGRAYDYQPQKYTFTLRSLGPDGKGDTSDDVSAAKGL
jgi:type II secretory pathway pseudopilin PulG